MPLLWADFSVSPIDFGATAMTQAAPARPESRTALRSVVCFVGSKFGSWMIVSQPLDLPYPVTPTDRPLRAGGASESGEKTSVFGRVDAGALLLPESLDDGAADEEDDEDEELRDAELESLKRFINQLKEEIAVYRAEGEDGEGAGAARTG